MARRLNLTRNQLASFCKDFEQVRQFELLFAAVNSLLDSANDGANLAPPVMENVTVIGDDTGSGNLAPPTAESITYIQNVIGSDALAPENQENNSVKTDYIDFDREAPVVSTPGRLWWDENEKTAVLALSGGNVELHLGQEELQDCYNGTGATLAKGTVVQVTGAQGNRLRIAKAQANTEATSVHTFGFVDESIASGAEGFVINSGLIRNLNTINDSEGNALTAGDTLYLSTSVAGGYTRVKPVAPDQLVIVGFAVRISATVGSIFVKVDNGYEIEELHNVKVTAPVLAGSLLIYDDTLDVWKNAQITGGSNVTVTNGDASITISAAGGPVSADATASDVINVSSQVLYGVDPSVAGDLITEAGGKILQEDGSKIILDSAAPSDQIIFWDDSAGKLTHLGTSAPIQITGTNLEHATSGAAAATYGSATQVSQVTVDTFGHVTSAGNVTISGVTPSAHASTHQHGGSDEVATATAAPNAIPKADAAGQLAAGWMPALTGDVTTTAGSTSTTIANDAVTYAKIQNVGANSVLARAAATAGDVGEVPIAASQLLGRGSTGDVAAITLGTNLSMSGTTINATGGGSVTIGVSAADVLSVTGSQIDGVDPNADRIVFWDDSAGKLTYLTAGTNLSISGTSLNASVSFPNNFGTIAVAGQSNVVADVDSDTLNLAASNMVSITTTPASDTVTINVPLLTGDVTTTSAGAATIAANAVDNTKLNDMAAGTIKGNNTGASADPIDLNATQVTAMLNTFTSTLKGLAPFSGGGTTNYLRADGTWQAPPGNVSIGASADAVLSASGGTIDAVSPAKNKLVAWNQTALELRYAEPVNGLSLTGDILDWTGGTATLGVTLVAGSLTTTPLKFQSGTLNTTPVAGAVEFNSAFHATPNTTTGRGYLSPNFGYWQNAAGSAIGSAGVTVDYFPATSSINLEANATYEIQAFAYFLKTTAGTVAWRWLASQLCDVLVSTYIGTAATGFTTTATTAAPITGSAAIRSNTTLTHAATASLTTAVYHAHTLQLRVETGTSACNLRLQLTPSAGSITPQIGSYYRVIKIQTSGSFAL